MNGCIHYEWLEVASLTTIYLPSKSDWLAIFTAYSAS
jgi:hypothetical protein